MTKPIPTFPLPDRYLKPLGGFEVRTLGEFRAMTARLPDSTLLWPDESDEYLFEVDYEPAGDNLEEGVIFFQVMPDMRNRRTP